MAGAAQPFSGLQEAVASLYGNAVQILRRDPVTGGDINRAYMLKLSDGRKNTLMRWN